MNISKRAEELFARVLTVDSDTRAEYVATACGADQALLDEVYSLLEASKQSEAYFEQLSENIGLPALAEDGDKLPVNKLIGKWRLLEVIGRGGMGAVYLAERADEQFEKQAALKILPFGLDGRGARSRFLQERQILAGLVHENIARLLDGGVTDEGSPYFVMDYVDGLPIDVYCDEQQLNIDARLALFCQVGEAVQYAHRNLVVHRDLKPSNVLVNRAGEVKLLDFGIAKALHTDGRSPQLTRTGLSPMTSLYASPEMLKREPVTTVSDVYALGILLYELLAGRHPYELQPQSSGPDIWRQVCDVETPQLSTAVLADSGDERSGNSRERASRRKLTRRRLQQRLRGDLDAIAAKALRKNPEDRYGSVDRLLADIRRHLNGLPVQAQPPSFAYRARKFVVRRKGLVVAGAASVLFLLTVVYQADQTARESERANREADIANQVTDFLVSIFEVSNPLEARGNSITARELLDRGAAEIAAGGVDDPEVRARLMSTVAHVYERLALYSEAEALFDDAVEMQRQALGESHQQTLLTTMRMGLLYLEQSRFAEAEQTLSRALDGQRRILGDDHPESLESMHNLAIAHAQQGDFAMAEALGEELVATRRRVLGPDDDSTLQSTANLAIFLKLQGYYERAEALFHDVLDTRMKTSDDDHPDVMAAMQNLADLYSDQARYAEAIPLYEDAIASANRLYGSEHPETTRATINFANTYQAMGELDKAESLYVGTVAIQRATLGDEHFETLNGIAKLGELYTRQERYEEGKELLIEALAAYRRTLGDGHTKTLDTVTKLSYVHYLLGNADELRDLTIERIAQRRKLAERDGASPQDRLTLAWILLTCEPEDLRDPAAALPLAIQANAETNHSEARFMRVLALAYHLTGDSGLAVTTQEQAIALLPEGDSQKRTEFVAILSEFNAR